MLFYHGIGIHHHLKSTSNYHWDLDRVDIQPSLNYNHNNNFNKESEEKEERRKKKTCFE